MFDYQKEIEHGVLMLSCEILTKDYSRGFTLYLDENKNVLEREVCLKEEGYE